MALKPADIDNLTLGDLEAIAKRLRVMLETLREARQLLGGNLAPVEEIAKPPPQLKAVGAPPGLTTDELAKRDMLMAQFRNASASDDPNFPGLAGLDDAPPVPKQRRNGK